MKRTKHTSPFTTRLFVKLHLDFLPAIANPHSHGTTRRSPTSNVTLAFSDQHNYIQWLFPTDEESEPWMLQSIDLLGTYTEIWRRLHKMNLPK